VAIGQRTPGGRPGPEPSRLSRGAEEIRLKGEVTNGLGADRIALGGHGDSPDDCEKLMAAVTE
jgi:hypothetical protein